MSAMDFGFKLGAVFALALSPFAAQAIRGESRSSAALEPPGRVWHVAPGRIAGVAEQEQFRTISAAAQAVGPGDTVMIHAGVYREAVVVATNGTADRPIRFEAAPHARVIVDGADVITGWRREKQDGDRIFSVPWPHRFIGWSKTRTHPDDDHHLLIGRAEQVFVRDYPLRQVLRRERMERGTFFVDEQAGRLYTWGSANEDLAKLRVEASVRSTSWDCRGDFVHLRGVRFRHAANAAQQGAARFHGRGDVVEDCIFEQTNSCGAAFLGPDQVVRRCTFQDNGQLGFGTNRSHNLLFTECVTRRNNTKNFDRGWEAGGDKLTFSRNVVIERSRFEENAGSGIWFDIGNEDCTVKNCLIADNQDAGIFYEISYGLRASDNVLIGNGLADSPGAWGASAGICLSSSPGCVIERNLFCANKEGFAFREQSRTTPRIDHRPGRREEPVWNHDEIVRQNSFVANRDAQVWGWFDTDDGRQWPAASPLYQSARNKGPSLESLHIRFADNLYDPPPDQAFFHWGVGWKPNKAYATLEEVRGGLGLEQGGRVAHLVVHDGLTRDLRVPPDSPALALGAYPRGEVPGVRLGVLEPVSEKDRRD